MARLEPLPHWEASLAEALPDVVAQDGPAEPA
jgi:hypothetical protein